MINRLLALAGLLCLTVVGKADIPAWVSRVDLGRADWMIIAAILVLFMVFPGVMLFYGGLVRRKNVLSIILQAAAVVSMTTLMWVLIGYALSFGTSHMPTDAVIGNITDTFLFHLHQNLSEHHSVKLAFAIYQMGFAVIAPVLILGGVAERIKFKAVMVFIFFWELLVYYPVAHTVWGGGFLYHMGVLDYAGGLVVHVSSGVAALVAACLLGKRCLGQVKEVEPHNRVFVVIGIGILWIGWFGFNGGGSENFHILGVAILNTQLAAISAILFKLFLDHLVRRRVTVIGTSAAAISGLVAITPAAGFVGVFGAILIGLISSAICHFAVRWRHSLGYDDALDAFGLHGVAGLVGAMLVGVFISARLGGAGYPPGLTVNKQLWVQFLAALLVAAWSAFWTFVILSVMKRCFSIRVEKADELAGLDISQHGEVGYIDD
ncbi:MAG: hypothetical protein COV52_07660 [Gammaproteobacteria bacterium CG11_big_fil_rev_8_21_14_0_20_46_22]|nr:MAG: hypothetical protein COW05_03740 [Gammaproteobacteria bacterium CG12_big_fil_rev_8_21_14_0_65_46_12]PIR10634.1 MAG: hypothetical protein COV52_07660 [Gammaproteobacteria bacterium CG11_big_fil_rev_8_21_14_0_20_46_22]